MKKIFFLFVLLNLASAQTDIEWSLDENFDARKGLPSVFYELGDKVYVILWKKSPTVYVYGIPTGSKFKVFLEERNREMKVLNTYELTDKIKALDLKSLSVEGFFEAKGRMYTLLSSYDKKAKAVKVMKMEILKNGSMGVPAEICSFNTLNDMKDSYLKLDMTQDESVLIVQNFKKKKNENYYARAIRINEDWSKVWESEVFSNEYHYPYFKSGTNGSVLCVNRDEKGLVKLNHINSEGEHSNSTLDFPQTMDIKTFIFNKGKFGNYILVGGYFEDSDEKGAYYFKYDFENANVLEEAFVIFDEVSDEEGKKELVAKQDELAVQVYRQMASKYTRTDYYKPMTCYEVSENEVVQIGYVRTKYTIGKVVYGNLNYSYILTSFKNTKRNWTAWVANGMHPGIPAYYSTFDAGCHLLTYSEGDFKIYFNDLNGPNTTRENEEKIKSYRTGFATVASINSSGEVVFESTEDFKKQEYLVNFGAQCYNQKRDKVLFYTYKMDDYSKVRLGKIVNVIY